MNRSISISCGRPRLVVNQHPINFPLVLKDLRKEFLAVVHPNHVWEPLLSFQMVRTRIKRSVRSYVTISMAMASLFKSSMILKVRNRELGYKVSLMKSADQTSLRPFGTNTEREVRKCPMMSSAINHSPWPS